MKNSRFKKAIRTLHLWLGLPSGIIVFIIAITGCLYAFQEEIQNITEDYRFVKEQDATFLLPSKLEEIARKELPNKTLHAIQYKGNHQSAEAIFYHYDEKIEANNYYQIVHLNPYTGEVLEINDLYSGFFRWILDGHFYLWLPHELGQTVIASATLIFVLMIISGFLLWFPKNKKAAQQRFWFRWKDGIKWKRKNYDLHNITGFYVMAIALIFAVTGLVWGFPWFAYGYYSLIGGEKSLVYEDPISALTTTSQPIQNPIDKVYVMMKSDYPNAVSIEVHPPETATSAIAANANLDEGTYWKTDYRYFDQYTLEEQKVNHIYGKLNDASTSDKLMRMNYDIHTGAVLGLAGKIFAFLISLLIASLPVTGFLIWFGRRNKPLKTKIMCCNYSILNQSENGMLVLLKGCGNYQLTFNNLNFNLTPFELEHLTHFLKTIDCNYWEKEYENSIYKKKIPIPTLQTNLMILLNRFEVSELIELLSCKKTEKLLHAKDINYRTNWN